MKIVLQSGAILAALGVLTAILLSPHSDPPDGATREDATPTNAEPPAAPPRDFELVAAKPERASAAHDDARGVSPQTADSLCGVLANALAATRLDVAAKMTAAETTAGDAAEEAYTELLTALMIEAKLGAAIAPTRRGDLTPYTEACTETADVTYVGGEVAGTTYVIALHRSQNPQVFAIKDHLAEMQSHLRTKVADAFNALPYAERRRRIEAHDTARAEMKQASKRPLRASPPACERAADLQATVERGRSLLDRLLPSFLQIDRATMQVHAERSIGLLK
jgi:hypothetical protein